VKLRIDGSRCHGHAMCYLLATELFDVDDDGRGSVLNEHFAAEHVDKARVAVERCPEQAIILELA
jgi:ferredoxin